MRRITGRLMAVLAVVCLVTTLMTACSGCETKVGKQYESVDLGLSVRWASMNLGATLPTDYGDCYAWGEVRAKEEFSPENYRFRKSDPSRPVSRVSDDSCLTKYCNDKALGLGGYVDSLSSLQPEDDAARVVMGGNWRIPTEEEFQELIDRCEWTWTTADKGACGYKVVGPSGKSIFLPATAQYVVQTDGTSNGHYWTSSLDASYPARARFLGFSNTMRGMSQGVRWSKCAIRPVEREVGRRP